MSEGLELEQLIQSVGFRVGHTAGMKPDAR